MEANALSTAKQNIRQLAKQKAELAAATPDRKKTRLLQRKIRLLKRATRVLATEKKAVVAKAAAEAAAKEAAEKAAAAKAAADAKAAAAKAAAEAAKAAEAQRAEASALCKVMNTPLPLRGRGSATNPKNRFESIERVPEPPENSDEISAPHTQFYPD